MGKKYPTAPKGTYGLAIAPWTPGETYAVAANWAEASSPVWAYGEKGWSTTPYQVADFRHSPHAALVCELAAALRASGEDDQAAHREAAELVEDAVTIFDQDGIAGIHLNGADRLTA